MMKKILLPSLFLLSSVLYCQSFEGKITYQNDYTSNLPNVTSDQLNTMMGMTQEYFFKDDKYKSVTNGSFSKWQIYIPTDNRLYSKLSISDTLLWSDGKSNLDAPISFEIEETQTEILGYKCNALIVTTKTGKSTYYFSDKIKIDGELFKNHQFGNWSVVAEQTNSLPLKVVMETPQFNLTSIAISVDEMKLESLVFDLPKAPVKKSPY